MPNTSRFRQKKDRLVKAVSISAVLKIANLVLGFALTAVVARLLGAEGFGVYTLAFVFSSVLGIIVQLGLPNLSLRETAQAGDTQDWLRMVRVWSWATKRIAIFSLIIVTGASAAVYIYFNGISNVGAQTGLVALLLLPLLAFEALKSAILRGLGHVSLGQLPSMVVRPALFLLLALSAASLSFEMDSTIIMLLRVCSAALTLLVVVFLLNRHIPRAAKLFKPDGHIDASWSVASMSMAVTAGMALLTNYADILILGLFTPADEVGRYRVAFQMSMLVAFGLRAVAMVSAPKFARLKNLETSTQLQDMARVSARLSFISAAIIAILLFFLGKLILVSVFGKEFEGAYSLVVLLVLGQLVNAFFGPIGTLMSMTGFEQKAAKIMVVAACLNIALNFLMVPFIGSIGAALATLISFLYWNCCMWRELQIKRSVRCDPFAKSSLESL